MKTISAVVVIGLLSTNIVLAETETQSPIIVTATRNAESVDETLATVSVITRQDIEASQAREIVDLLRLEAGIDLSANGGPGNTANVFLRGSNSNHTLFMIDGMRVASSTTGTFAIERLSLDQIEKIEIVRGPRATQYGSDAMGGIIHIFTRNNQTQHARVGFGSFGTHEGSAGISLGEKVRLNVNASYEHANGFSSTNTTNLFSYDPDQDAYRKNNYSFGLTVPAGKDIEFNLKGLATNSWSEFDAGAGIYAASQTEGQDYIANLKQQVSDTWSYKASVGYNDDDVQTQSGNPSSIKTNRIMYDLQNDLVLSDTMLLMVGFTRYEDAAENIELTGNTVVFDQDIDNNALFTNLSISSGDHDLLASYRYDDHSNFGGHNSGLLSWGYKLNENARLTATISNAFRAPTINELYHPGFGGFYKGNPNLNPEEMDGAEISMRIKDGAHQVQLAYFKNWFKNLISYSGGATFDAENINRARTEGLELHHQWSEDKWSTHTNLTLQQTLNEATGTELLRRPRNKLAFVLQHQHNQDSSTRLEMLAASKRSDFGGVTLPGYAVFNLGTRIKLEKHLWLDARLDNITNKQYELAQGYNTADRSMFFGLSYQLDKYGDIIVSQLL